MRDVRLLRSGLALAAVASATIVVGFVNAPLANAEPECLTNSYDFDQNGITDFAAGMPGADDGAGDTEVLLGVDDLHEYHRPVDVTDLRPGDQFGAAIGEVAYYENEGEDSRCSQLVVGAPGRDVDGKQDAGAIFLFAWDSGERAFTVVNEFVQGRDGVGGETRTGARFGASLASPYHADNVGSTVTPLYVGAPGGGPTGAGEVVKMKFGGQDPTAVETQVIAQGSGMPGTAERGDGFGTSIATVVDGAVIGVPGENDGAGGVVHWVATNPSKSRFVTQNTAGVPGTSEAGDEFGQALATTPAASGFAAATMVGAPGEAIGSLRSAGAVVVFNDALGTRQVKGYNQDTPGIAGAAETGDRFGASVATNDVTDLVAGVPGEDIGAAVDAGMINSLSRNASWTQNDTCYPYAKPESGDRLGASMANVGTPTSGYGPLVGVPGENNGSGLVHHSPAGDGPTCETWTQTDPLAGDALGTAVGKTN